MLGHEDPNLDKRLRRRNRLLLIGYLTIAGLCLLPAIGLAFNSSSPVLGIPRSILWLAGCFAALAALTALGHWTVFAPWSRTADRRRDHESSKEAP